AYEQPLRPRFRASGSGSVRRVSRDGRDRTVGAAGRRGFSSEATEEAGTVGPGARRGRAGAAGPGEETRFRPPPGCRVTSTRRTPRARPGDAFAGPYSSVGRASPW